MALGGECVPNDGKWEVGPTTVDLTDLGKEFFGVETLVSIMHRVNMTRQINSSSTRTSNKCTEIMSQSSHQLSTYWARRRFP